MRKGDLGTAYYPLPIHYGWREEMARAISVTILCSDNPGVSQLQSVYTLLAHSPFQCSHTHTHQSSSSRAWQETSKGYLRRQTLGGCWGTWVSYTAAGLTGLPLLLEAPNRQSSGLVSLAVEQTLPWCRESPVPLGSRLSVLYCTLFAVSPHKTDKLVYLSSMLFESLGTNTCRLQRFLNLHLQCFPVLD